MLPFFRSLSASSRSGFPVVNPAACSCFGSFPRRSTCFPFAFASGPCFCLVCSFGIARSFDRALRSSSMIQRTQKRTFRRLLPVAWVAFLLYFLRKSGLVLVEPKFLRAFHLLSFGPEGAFVWRAEAMRFLNCLREGACAGLPGGAHRVPLAGS